MLSFDHYHEHPGSYIAWDARNGDTVARLTVDDVASMLVVTFDPAKAPKNREWREFVKGCHEQAGDLGYGVRFVEGQP